MTEELELDYRNYTKLAFIRRGAIINETIMLARLIDDILSHYFCGLSPKKQELMELIICTNRMIFENKVQVLKVLLEKHNPLFLKSNHTLFTDIINIIIPERNIFAHYWLVTTAKMSEFIKNNQTVFIKFKNTTEYLYYNENDVANIHTSINKSIRAFQELQQVDF